MWSVIMKLQVRLQSSDLGATAVEYALMVALVATVIIGAVTFLGTSLTGLFNWAATRV